MSSSKSDIKQQREEEIFNSALKVIKEKGFHHARMSDIAREAGISYGLVYHYFKNKDALFDAIQKRWWGGIFHVMERANSKQISTSEKLSRIIDYFLDTYHKYPELMNIFITEISRSTTNLSYERLAFFKKFMDLTDSIMLEGQKSGVLRDDFKARYLTYIFLGSLETFVSAMVLVDQKLKGDSQKQRIAKSILDVFLNGAKKKK